MLVDRWISTVGLLQAHEYDIRRWWHTLRNKPGQKVQPVWTAKLRLVALLAAVVVVSSTAIIYVVAGKVAGVVFGSFMLALPSSVVWLVIIMMRPFERWYWRRIRHAVSLALAAYPDLTKIAITGSYGKTSCKDIVYAILEMHDYSLVTPANLNTIAGLKRVVNLELNKRHRFGIFEMGAYGPGDIDVHASAIQPNWGIITAVGPQHLERYDSINQITETKFELARYLNQGGLLVNIDSQPIREYVALHPQVKPHTVSVKDASADFYVSSYQFIQGQIMLTLEYSQKIYHFQLPGFGTARVYAAAHAIAISLMLKIPETAIHRGLRICSPDAHRLGISKKNSATIIDNTYSSNPDSFNLVISDVATIAGKKALITPGLLELGSSSNNLHQELGKKAGEVFNTIILVGDSERTRSMAVGIKAARHATQSAIDPDYTSYWQLVESLSQDHDLIVLENDIPKHLL